MGSKKARKVVKGIAKNSVENAKNPRELAATARRDAATVPKFTRALFGAAFRKVTGRKWSSVRKQGRIRRK